MSEQFKNTVLAIIKKKAIYGVPSVIAILKSDYGIQETNYLVH